MATFNCTVGTWQFQIGGPCNGAGSCVNGACVCNSLYDGGSDFFDTRLPSGESLTCTNSRVGEIIVWVLLIVVIAFRTKEMVPVFATQLERNRGQKTTSTSVKIMTVDLILMSPLCLALAGLKIAGNVIGTDVAVTVLFFSTVALFQYVTVALEDHQFRTLVHTLDRNNKTLPAFRYRLHLFGIGVYFFGVVIPSSLALVTNKVLDPIASKEFLVIIIRNIFVVVWGIFEALAAGVVRTYMIKEYAHYTSSNNDHIGSGKRQKLSNIIKKTQYGFFILPWFWPYQTYLLAVALSFGAMRHSGKVFKTVTVKGSSSNNNDDTAFSPVVVSSGHEVTKARPSFTAPTSYQETHSPELKN